MACRGAKDDRQFIFTGKGKATQKEIEFLIKLDKRNLKFKGFHLVENYQDLYINNN